MALLNRRLCLWVVCSLGGLSISCRGDKPSPTPHLDAGADTSDSGAPPIHRAQTLTGASNAKGIARLGAEATGFAELFLIDAETQKPISDAVIEGLADEGGDDGYLVRVSKATGGYRPELVRVRRGGQRTVPLSASTADLPGRAVRLSQKVYNQDFLGEADLGGVNQLAERESRPEIVFSPVLDGSSMMNARFNVYRSSLPATLLAFKVEDGRPAEGSLVRTRARVVSTSGPRRAGARVSATQLAAAGEKRDDDSHVAPIVSSLTVAAPDSEGKAMVGWNVEDPEHSVLAFEVGIDTTRPGQRVAAQMRALPISVRRGEHFVCVRPVFPGSDLEPELRCQSFEAPEAPAAPNVRVRVRPPAADANAPRRRQPMPVEVEVENLGDTDAPPFQVDVVLSRDGRSEGGLGEARTISVDGVKRKSMSVRKTEITPPRDGALYVVARADSGRQLIETNAEDNNDRLPIDVMPMGDNHAPVLSVAGTTVGGATAGRLIRGQPLKLRASADDQEDGDLSSNIGWYSSRDGKLADGATLDTSALSPGLHRVRAQVSDHGAAPAAARPQPSFWRRLFSFGDDIRAPEIIADDPPETVSAEFTIEVVEPEMARAAQSPPVVSAGPDLTTTVGGEVTPLATASDADGDTLTVSWTAKNADGVDAEVLDASKLRPRFHPAAAGRYRLVLSVSDGHSSERDEMEVLALSPEVNHPPQVSIRMQESASVGSLVRAEAFAADPTDHDGVTVNYVFTQRPAGSAVLIADAETFSPSFVPDLPGQYRLAVIADDGRGGRAYAEASTYAYGSAPIGDAGAPDVPVPGPDGGGTMTGAANGSACGGPGACQSGNCVEGVCCDSPCFGLCNSCRRPNQLGTCGPVASGQDPREECPSTATCNGSGSCSAFAIRPGSELVASGSIELAGTPYTDPGSEDADRVPLTCDPASGLCAFFRMSTNPESGSQADLLVVDARSPGPLQPRSIASGVNFYGAPTPGSHGVSRGGFMRGTLMYVSMYNEVFAWQSGWTAPHRLATSGSTCVVSRNGRYAACETNHSYQQDGSENYDIAFGPLTDGGAPLPVQISFNRLSNDNHGDLAAFAPDERWLAVRGRSGPGAPPAVVLYQLPSGAPVTVLAEEGLDRDMQFSPDSRYLAFMRGVVRTEVDRDPAGTLSFADVSMAPTLHDLLAGVQGFGWWQPSPDQPVQLAFMNGVANQRGKLQKFTDITAPSPQPVLLLDKIYAPTSDSGETIVFAPAVGRLAVQRDADDDNIPELWGLDLGTGNSSKLAAGFNFSAAAYPPVFSPAGDQLAWGGMLVDTQTLFLSKLFSGTAPLLVGGRATRAEFAAGGSLLFTEGDPYRLVQTRALGYYGPTATLRLYDGSGFPARVIQPGVRDSFALAGSYALFVVAGQGLSDGLYRISLTGTPPMSCDPLAQSGCANGQGCFLRGPGDVAGCGPAGGGGLQATCGTDAECTRGYQCSSGSCLQICATGGSPCPGATPYCQPGPGNAYLGLCLTAPPASACDPVRRTGCLATDVCQVSYDGVHTCGPAGVAAENQACGQNADCSPGLGCFYESADGVLCRAYCDINNPGTCPQQTPNCKGLPNTWVGYCVGAPPPVCDPVKQIGCATDQACYLDQSGATSCNYPGGGVFGSPCASPYDCGRGLGCFDSPTGRSCRSYCSSDQTCPQNAPTCVVTNQQQGYGVCTDTGGGPPSSPDGGPPPSPDGGTAL